MTTSRHLLSRAATTPGAGPLSANTNTLRTCSGRDAILFLIVAPVTGPRQLAALDLLLQRHRDGQRAEKRPLVLDPRGPVRNDFFECGGDGFEELGARGLRRPAEPAEG